MYPPDRINSVLQSELSSPQENNKTNLTPEETVEDLRDKFGKNFYISFVRGYKGQVPNVDINPYAGYATPHGVYTYLLTKENLESLFLKGQLFDSTFAINRPYFHIIQLKTPNTAVLNPNKTSNYYANNTEKYYSDVQEMVRISLLSLPLDMSYLNRKIYTLPRHVKEKYKNLNSKNYLSFIYASGHRATRIASAIELAYKKVIVDMNEVSFNEFTTTISNVLHNKANSMYSSRMSNAKNNKFYFLNNIYRIAEILSYITPNPKTGSGRHNDPVRRSLMLHSIGIDTLVDAGSSTIHDKQPTQAVSINFGPHSNIENLGTYNNIFHQLSKRELKKLYIENADYLH